MYKKVLVPLDGSKLAEMALLYAMEFAFRLKLEVTILHVCSPEEEQLLPMHQAYIERAGRIMGRESDDLQIRRGYGPHDKSLRPRTELLIGDPAEQILRYTAENNIDLILLSPHGLSGVKRQTLGPEISKVLRVSKAPVFVAPPRIPKHIMHNTWPARTVVVPLDGSKAAELAIPYAEMLVKQMGAQIVDIILLRVCEPPKAASTSDPSPSESEKYIEKETAECKSMATEYLSEIQKHVKRLGFKAKTAILVGKADREIVNYANQDPFNIIVMSTENRSGGMARKILQHSSCPTILANPH